MKSESVELPKSQTHSEDTAGLSQISVPSARSNEYRDVHLFSDDFLSFWYSLCWRNRNSMIGMSSVFMNVLKMASRISNHILISLRVAYKHTYSHACIPITFFEQFCGYYELHCVSICRLLSTWSNIHFRARLIFATKKIWDILAASIKIGNQFIVKKYHENCLDNRISYGLYAKNGFNKGIANDVMTPKRFQNAYSKGLNQLNLISFNSFCLFFSAVFIQL